VSALSQDYQYQLNPFLRSFRTYHHDDMLNSIRQCLVPALLPISRRCAVFTKHHGRPVRKEMHRCQRLSGNSVLSVDGHAGNRQLQY